MPSNPSEPQPQPPTPAGGPPGSVDPAELGALAERLAHEAGALLLEGWRHARSLVQAKSTPTDVVTEMDMASEALVRKGILDARPDDAVLGEEEGEGQGSSGVRWLVDPLDGTVNYLYGLAPFAVSIAAEVGGKVIAGVVHDPVHQETWSATAGGGAWSGAEAIHRASAPSVSQSLVGTGFSYAAERRRRQAAVLATVLPEVRDIRRMGAAAVDICSVALGRLDAFYEIGLEPWDLAAGCLIAGEAGCWVGDLGGGPPSGEITVVCAPGMEQELGALLRRGGA